MTKISSLAALTGAEADAAADLVPVVDMSEAGAARNKSMTLAEVFAALAEMVDDRVGGLLVAGSNVSLSYDDEAGTLTLSASTPSTGDISGFNEAVDDRVAALVRPGAGVSIVYDDTAGTFTISSTVAALNGAAEWAPNWTGDADWYLPVVEAMTIDQGNAAIGTGAIAFQASTAAAPATFADATLPVTLEAGAWLKVSATGVSGFLATHLVRTA